MMLVGGGRFGGIHGAHMGPGVRHPVRRLGQKAPDHPLGRIPQHGTGVTRTYLAADAKPDALSSLPTFEMQCVDCHNRAAHSFELPDRAVDDAMARGRDSGGVAFRQEDRRRAAEGQLLRATRKLAQKIPAGLSASISRNIRTSRANDPSIQAAGQALLAIYRHNVFPDLKVTWGTYPNNLGHADDPGCFRCHDDSHATADKKHHHSGLQHLPSVAGG